MRVLTTCLVLVSTTATILGSLSGRPPSHASVQFDERAVLDVAALHLSALLDPPRYAGRPGAWVLGRVSPGMPYGEELGRRYDPVTRKTLDPPDPRVIDIWPGSVDGTDLTVPGRAVRFEYAWENPSGSASVISQLRPEYAPFQGGHGGTCVFAWFEDGGRRIESPAVYLIPDEWSRWVGPALADHRERVARRPRPATRPATRPSDVRDLVEAVSAENPFTAIDAFRRLTDPAEVAPGTAPNTAEDAIKRATGYRQAVFAQMYLAARTEARDAAAAPLLQPVIDAVPGPASLEGLALGAMSVANRTPSAAARAEAVRTLNSIRRATRRPEAGRAGEPADYLGFVLRAAGE